MIEALGVIRVLELGVAVDAIPTVRTALDLRRELCLGDPGTVLVQAVVDHRLCTCPAHR